MATPPGLNQQNTRQRGGVILARRHVLERIKVKGIVSKHQVLYNKSLQHTEWKPRIQTWPSSSSLNVITVATWHRKRFRHKRITSLDYLSGRQWLYPPTYVAKQYRKRRYSYCSYVIPMWTPRYQHTIIYTGRTITTRHRLYQSEWRWVYTTIRREGEYLWSIASKNTSWAQLLSITGHG